MRIKRDGSRHGLTALALSPHTDGREGSILHMPAPRSAVRHAVPIVLEGVVGPLALFYGTLLLFGFRGALVAALAWSYVALARRLVRHERISTLLILGTMLITLRVVISFLTGSALFYFVQPLAGTVVIAFVLIGSAILRRPFTQRFAHDFCPLTPELLALPRVQQFFVRVSWMWAGVLLVNSGVVLWLLLTASLRSFVLERTAVTWTTTSFAIAASIIGFVRTMRSDGVTVHWGASALNALEPAA